MFLRKYDRWACLLINRVIEMLILQMMGRTCFPIAARSLRKGTSVAARRVRFICSCSTLVTRTWTGLSITILRPNGRSDKCAAWTRNPYLRGHWPWPWPAIAGYRGHGARSGLKLGCKARGVDKIDTRGQKTSVGLLHTYRQMLPRLFLSGNKDRPFS